MIERRERGIRWLVGWKNRQAGIAAAFRRCYSVRISFLAYGLVLIGDFLGRNTCTTNIQCPRKALFSVHGGENYM